MLRTWLTTRFALSVPLVSAPMAGAAGGRLAAAVSAAGGLGMIGVADLATPQWIREQAALAAGAGPYGIGLLGWCRPDRNGQLDAVLGLPAPPALVSVSFDAIAREHTWLPRLREAGIVGATQVCSPADAERAAGAGVEVLVARGGEGGGHGRNAVATLPLLQELLDSPACAGLPLLAAGGIATARGLAAVLAAGAAGAWVGTAFLTTSESLVPPAGKARLQAAASTDTVYTGAYDRGYQLGWPVEYGGRALRTSFTDTWTGREAELADAGSEPAARARQELAAARAAGDYDIAGLYAGQAVGLLHGQRSAADVVASMARAEDLLRRWSPVREDT